MLPETRFGGAPVRDRIPVRFVRARKPRLVPVAVERRVALERQRLMIALAKRRVEDELWHAPRVAVERRVALERQRLMLALPRPRVEDKHGPVARVAHELRL